MAASRSRQCGEGCIHAVPTGRRHVAAHQNRNLPLRREAASDWGLQCMRYEIRDINPPTGVRAAMELQARRGWLCCVFPASRGP